MYNISVRRALEEGYGLVAKNGEPLKFDTEEEAKEYALNNIEGKSMWIVSWFISKTTVGTTSNF